VSPFPESHRRSILERRHSNVRDIDTKLNLEADASFFYWQEAQYWTFEAIVAARKVWQYRRNTSQGLSKTGFELQKAIEDRWEYKVLVADQQFFERLANMFANMVTAGVQMEVRDGYEYTIAGEPRRAKDPTRR
jgi:hypothetical protein